METVTFKLQEDILNKVDSLLPVLNFNNRTEFIREAVRDKILQVERENDPFMKALLKFKGGAKVHVSDEQLHATGEKVFRKLAKEYGVDLD